MKKKLVLFVHGLGGSRETWGKFPILIQTAPELKNNYSVKFYEYSTTISPVLLKKKSPKIQTISNGLRSFINYQCSDYEFIYLICHSLGGLVARYYLTEEIKLDSKLKCKKLILFSVPNNGAELAKLGSISVFNNKTIKQLNKKSDFLHSLNNDWETFKVKEKINIKYIIAGLDSIVDEGSSTHYWGDKNCEWVVDKGHTDIVKPDSFGDLSFKIVSRFLRETEPLLHGKITNNDEEHLVVFLITLDFIVSEIIAIHRGSLGTTRRIFDIVYKSHKKLNPLFLAIKPYLNDHISSLIEKLINSNLKNFLNEGVYVFPKIGEDKYILSTDYLKKYRYNVISTWDMIKDYVLKDEILLMKFEKLKNDEIKYWKLLGFADSNEYTQKIQPNTEEMLKNANMVEIKLLHYLIDKEQVTEKELIDYGFPKSVIVEVINPLLRDELIKSENTTFILNYLARDIFKTHLEKIK